MTPTSQPNSVALTAPLGRLATMARRTLCAVAILLVMPAAASAYVIYFLDGSQIEVRAPYTVQDGRALVVKLSGEQTTIDLALIDQEKTSRNNVGGLSDVIVIDTEGTRQFAHGQNRQTGPETLREAIASGRVRTRDLSAEVNPNDRSNSNSSLPLTAGGFPDLQQMLRDPLGNTDLEGELTSALRAVGLSKFRLYKGSAENRLMVEISADGRFEVFTQLEALAGGHRLAFDSGGFNAIEVLMLNKQRSRSAQFVLTRENIPLLANGILTPGEFFIQYVQF